MSQFLSSTLAIRMHGLFDNIGYWWSHATPNDFGLMAVTIVVTAWFVTKYYVD